MLLRGAIYFALPLVLASSLGAQLALLSQRAIDHVQMSAQEATRAQDADWYQHAYAPRSTGEIRCWELRDASVRATELCTDPAGNIYVQDPATSQLRALRLRPGFRLDAELGGDWMSRRLIDQAQPVPTGL